MTGVRQIAVPPEARALTTLARIDYEDAFLVDVTAARARTAEGWARAIFDGAPARARARLWSGWRALGLRVGPPRSRALVLGWELRRNTPEVALLGARSWIGMPAELLVWRRRPEALVFATFVHKGNPLARAVWAAVDPVHRPTVRRILERTLARERRRSG